MKRSLFYLICCLFMLSIGNVASAQNDAKSAMDVISRTLGYTPKNVSIQLVKSETELDYFTTEVSGGVLKITATSPTAACRAFYDYVTENHYGISTWSINNIKLPRQLKDSPMKRVDCNVKYRYFINPCTFCYTTPFWTWKEWEQELDRMALHGVNLALSYTGFEAIFYRVWKKLGLTDEEINDFVTGPSHLTWVRIGNMSKLDGGLSQEYYKFTIDLQHKILDRMNELSMTPIFVGFAGFVPDGIKRLYPDVQLQTAGWTGELPFATNYLPANTELFKKIAGMYYKEREAEFGKGYLFQANSFNEMKVPFAPKGTQERFDQISSYGKAMYESIAEFVPNGIWVLGGWMFGYARKIWDSESMRAMFAKVPNDGFMLLDLATDYNHDVWENIPTWDHAPALYGKSWVYSTVPNFGGRTSPVGNLDFYLNGHVNALESHNRGNLVGIGSAPEGIENNDVVYEIIFDAPWTSKRRDVIERLREYSLNRYGACPPEMEEFWKGMVKSAHRFSSSQNIYRLQRRPFSTRGGRYELTPEYFKAIESFVKASSKLGKNENYKLDLAKWAGFYAYGKAELIANEIERCYKLGDKAKAAALREQFRDAMLTADNFLDSYPTLRLQRWIDFARNLGTTPEEKDKFEINARRVITTWGPGRNSVYLNDYAAKIWSGLIRNYYLPRMENYFDGRDKGVKFDFNAWEHTFADNLPALEPSNPYKNVIKEAHKMVAKYSSVSNRDDEIVGWNTFDINKGENKFDYMINPWDYSALKGLRFSHVRGNGNVKITKINIRGQRDSRFLLTDINKVVGKDNKELIIDLDINDPIYRKYTYLEIFVEGEKDQVESEVIVQMLKK